MTTIYKLTDEHDQTKYQTQWGINVSHEVAGAGDLCSPGWLHAYTNPLLAALLNPIHANFKHPHLWLADGEGNTRSDHGLKVGYTKITTIEQIDLPVIIQTQRVAFGILCALEVYRGLDFIKWANAWLDGSNRMVAYADAAAHAAHAGSVDSTDAIHDAHIAATYAARAAAGYASCYVHTRAAGAAFAAFAGAYAADTRAAVHAALDLDLVALAERAMTY